MSLNTVCTDLEVVAGKTDQLITSALDTLGDACALIDLYAGSVVWSSESLKEIFKGSSSIDIEYLCSVFYSLRRTLEHLKETRNKRETVESVVEIDGQLRQFSINCALVESQYVFLKLVDLMEANAQNKRYLEDREQLFSMSRTLSVSEMATALAHELNQPLGTLNNLLEGMVSRLPANSELIGAIQIAQQQTKYSAEVITRIRDYTRKKTPKFTNVDVAQLLDESVDLLDWELSRAAVKTSITTDTALTPLLAVNGDYVMLQQVLVNLIRNSVDAMQTKEINERVLKVQASSDETNVIISVCDHGTGLTDQQKETLFIPFTSSKPSGMGIGLNICRSFVELFHGRLWLDKNEFGGCTAYLSFPVVR